MPYVADPTNVTTPPDAGIPASVTAAELRALKVYLAAHIQTYLDSFFPVTTSIPAVTYSLVLEDHSSLVMSTSALATTFSFPNTLPRGYTCNFVQGGGGKLTIAALAGATLVAEGGKCSTPGQWAGITFRVLSNTSGTNAIGVICGDRVP